MRVCKSTNKKFWPKLGQAFSIMNLISDRYVNWTLLGRLYFHMTHSIKYTIRRPFSVRFRLASKFYLISIQVKDGMTN